MRVEEKLLIKSAVNNAIDFCGPPLTRAREIIEDEGKVFTDDMEKYAMLCIELYGILECDYCRRSYDISELELGDGGAICPSCGNTIDY